MLAQVAPPVPVGGGLLQNLSLDWLVMSASLCVLSGLVLLCWGLRNLWTRRRTVVLTHLSLSPLPVVITILGCSPVLLGLSGE